MNYYEHHLGDYMRDTAHLSMLEDGAYRRLLDAYYTREKALPADLPPCYKLARANTKQEREAVAYVLREFFGLTDDGHRQRRADEEIQRFRQKSAKARASINARWDRTRAEQNPKNERNTDVQRTTYERTTDDIHRAPVPSNQSPVTNTPPPPSGVAPLKESRPAKRAPEDFQPDADMRRWAAENAPGVDVDAETAKFRDHTFATARTDWPATWRNWFRKAAEASPPRPRAVPTASPMPAWKQQQLDRMAEFAGPLSTAAAKAAKPSAEVIDVTPRLVG